MAASFIHGWRVFQFARCAKTGSVVLQGSSNMHLHSRVQKVAECKGISPAVWVTQTARERLAVVEQGEVDAAAVHDGEAPDWDCTCGHYFYRTLKDAWNSEINVYAHVTCLERTMLHKNGGRTTQYSVDYLLAPTTPHLKAYIELANASQARAGNKAVLLGGLYGWVGQMEECDYAQELDSVALVLGVPILEREDLNGCPECLIVNSWRKPEEVTDQMKRDWFGRGYK